ncbi:MAG TPA: site-specific integrase [Geodermatophilus sp.]|nr:site-specific integrase [Geodermatophilus sp.]
MRLPTAAQVGAVLEAADPALRPFVALCAFAGLRLGEAAALQVGDVDFLRRTLVVARQVQRAGRDQVEVRPPKYGSERTVFLAPGLVDLLAAHVASHCPDGSWLFRGSGTEPPHQNTVGHRWRRTTSAAGLAGLRLHDLRHFYASGLIASGCDVVTVQRALDTPRRPPRCRPTRTCARAPRTARGPQRRLARRIVWTGCGLKTYCRPLT